MAENSWLYEQLRDKQWLEVDVVADELLRVRYGDRSYVIYVPDSDEYIITIDLVQRAVELGADTVSYAASWCFPSEEAVTWGKDHGVIVIPHGQLFGLLNCR